jgi:hypothetical protein
MKNALNPLEILPDTGVMVPGEVYMANASRLVEGYFSEPLTTYATGWRDSAPVEELLNFIAPPVTVNRRFEYAQFINAEAFLLDSSEEDVRAIGANFKEVEYTKTKATGVTENKGLTILVDRDNIGDMPNWEEIYTSKLMTRLMRSELYRAYNLMSAAATNTAKTWDTTALKDPDQDVLTELIASVDSSGVRPNRVLYNDVAWNKRGVAHRAQTTAGGFASAGMSPEQVTSIFQVDQVMVSKSRYVAAGGSTTKSKTIGDTVHMITAFDVATPEDPSNLKRFISPVEGGGRFRVYRQEINAKLIAITVEHYSKTVVTSTLGLRKLTIS